MGSFLLKYNTSVTLGPIGPFLSTSDGVTLKNALTIANEKITFVMQTSTGPVAIISNATASTTGANALNYLVTAAAEMQMALTAAQTAYYGKGKIDILDGANHCPVWEYVEIVSAEEFNRKHGGTALQPVNVSQIGGTNVSAGSAQIGANLVQINGSNISTGEAQLGVNLMRVAGTLQSAGNIVALVSALSADVIGPGANNVTLLIKDANDDPISDCEVWITSDVDGDVVIAGTLTTADDGTVLFHLNAGVTYYRWCRKAGMTFNNPASFIAVAD